MGESEQKFAKISIFSFFAKINFTKMLGKNVSKPLLYLNHFDPIFSLKGVKSKEWVAAYFPITLPKFAHL